MTVYKTSDGKCIEQYQAPQETQPEVPIVSERIKTKLMLGRITRALHSLLGVSFYRYDRKEDRFSPKIDIFSLSENDLVDIANDNYVYVEDYCIRKIRGTYKEVDAIIVGTTNSKLGGPLRVRRCIGETLGRLKNSQHGNH